MSLPVSQCRSCGAQIYWVQTVLGRNMPVDAIPVDDGNVIFIDQKAHVIRAGEEVPEDARRYVSHFSTCAQAKKHRKGRK
ncbi:MAG: hypothetical protein JNJ77_19950 [Planctomycetia bacterium]|nr:hypothetical protein [Planctomycetia bacterium]